MYKRILLKISGESLRGKGGSAIGKSEAEYIAREIAGLGNAGHEVAVVVGAGNIWRYRDTKELDIERIVSDAMGMLGTVINSTVLQSRLQSMGRESLVYSAIDVPRLAEPYDARKAIGHLLKGRIIFCAGGTGNPYFTTDSAAALRALELGCDLAIKATNVDGVYDCDPDKNPRAKKYDRLSFREALEKGLKVMDQTAFTLSMENGLPIIVLDLSTQGNILRAAKGEKIGTIIE